VKQPRDDAEKEENADERQEQVQHGLGNASHGFSLSA
jgi:hypothetical protein